MTASIVRDTWRAVLVVVVAIVLREVLADRPVPPQPVAATPTPFMAMPAPYMATPTAAPAPAWQPAPAPDNPKPLRRIGSAVVELGDSLIGAIRR